jgi:hypothetical protein
MSPGFDLALARSWVGVLCKSDGQVRDAGFSNPASKLMIELSCGLAPSLSAKAKINNVAYVRYRTDIG